MPATDDRDGIVGTDGVDGIVWMENGEVHTFEALPERRRPWLEESSAWGSGDPSARKPPADDDQDPPEIIWL